jgi:AcrR family transcriptional regulator
MKRNPDQTRRNLIAAAAIEIRKHGYFATDSNQIARAAGYAPASFYKHFADKREILLAVHSMWVDAEWNTLEHLTSAKEIVRFIVAHHARWRRLRASVRALIQTDAIVRKFHRAARRQQMQRLRLLTLARPGAMVRTDNSTALLLLEVERIADAIADGELAALGVSNAQAIEHLERQVASQMKLLIKR